MGLFNALLRVLTLFDKIFRQLGICATLGFIAGVIAGWFLLLYFLGSGGVNPMLPPQLALQMGLVLAAFDWVVLLFLLVGLSRYRWTAVFFPTLINCLLTCCITALLVSQFNLWLWSIFVGMVTGLIIGRLLCILYCRGDKRHGMY